MEKKEVEKGKRHKHTKGEKILTKEPKKQKKVNEMKEEREMETRTKRKQGNREE